MPLRRRRFCGSAVCNCPPTSTLRLCRTAPFVPGFDGRSGDTARSSTQTAFRRRSVAPEIHPPTALGCGHHPAAETAIQRWPLIPGPRHRLQRAARDRHAAAPSRSFSSADCVIADHGYVNISWKASRETTRRDGMSLVHLGIDPGVLRPPPTSDPRREFDVDVKSAEGAPSV
ncbi:hypothetical protein AURDEDRAFT_163791 [Auricularia subglabra TFB-10046 SS5]|nr:hypothetical protein AURDEDRAFT_163791 [Auricularia subglabra TFB-10046 SS5]